MIIKCPNCNGALEFDVKSGLMYCKFCGSFFTAEEVAMPETDPADTEGVSPWSPSEISDEVGTFNSGIEVTQYTDARGYNSNPQNYVFDIPTDIREANRTRYYEEQARLSEEYRARPKPDYTKPFAGTSDPRANMTKEERDYNVQEYYAKQAQLSEEYHRNKPDIDYTKPFDGTTRENMTMDEIVEANRRDREAREKMQAELDRIEKRAVFGSSSYPGAFGAYATEVNRATQEYERNINQKIALAGKTTPVTSQAWQTAADVAKANAGSERKPKEYMYTPSGSRIIQNTGGVYLVTDAPPDYGAEMMDNKVYTCTTCGAVSNIRIKSRDNH